MIIPQQVERSILSLVVFVAIVFAAMRADAVVIASGDGSGNTTAPADDPGFDSVGRIGSGGTVYVGNRWILTVAHLSIDPSGFATFAGSNYDLVVGSEVRLSNPSGSGLSGVVDLRMYRLDSEPGVAAVTIGSAAPSSGTDVVMIGRGNTRETGTTFWDVDTAPDPDVWTEVTPPPPADREGFKTDFPRTMRWGENEIDTTNLVVNAGFGDTASFNTVFDAGGMTHEAQAVAGDSGGGVFAKNGISWELIGMMHTVSTFSGQPGNTAVYGNTTNAADLAFYRGEILAIMATPEPSTSLLGLAGLLLFLRRRRA